MAKTEQQIFSENLSYCGFEAPVIARYLQLWNTGEKDAALCLLSCERGKLLDIIHTDQKKLDALDYMIYQTKNMEES